MPENDYREINGVIVLKKQHRMIQHLQEIYPAPAIHGTRVWNSSYLMMDYIDTFPPSENASIMEIGCGWGILSIYCARFYGSKLTALDADELVFPFLETHAILNEVRIATLVKRYEELRIKDLSGQEMMLGADICFWDALIDPLYSAIDSAMRANVERIVITDPGRSPFLKLAKRCKKEFGAELYEWDSTLPKKTDGYLLEIENY